MTFKFTQLLFLAEHDIVYECHSVKYDSTTELLCHFVHFYFFTGLSNAHIVLLSYVLCLGNDNCIFPTAKLGKLTTTNVQK